MENNLDSRKFTNEDLNKLRKLLTNGAPEWLILLAVVQENGMLKNTQTTRHLHQDAISPHRVRLSQARGKLTKNGLETVKSFRGGFTKLDYALMQNYRLLFESAFKILEYLDEKQITKAVNKIKKKAGGKA